MKKVSYWNIITGEGPGATQVQLSIEFQPQAVALKIRDNGKGFLVPKSPSEFVPSGHFGLLGLHERAELIEAGLNIVSTQGQGTEVKVF